MYLFYLYILFRVRTGEYPLAPGVVQTTVCEGEPSATSESKTTYCNPEIYPKSFAQVYWSNSINTPNHLRGLH